MNYIELLKKRRSVYKLSNDIPYKDEEIEKIIAEVLVESPTGYNMQSSKIIVLMNEEHRKLWDIEKDVLRAIVKPEHFQLTEDKIEMFKQAKGTILFYEDESIVEKYMNNIPLYKDKFPIFASHGMGILQGNMWNMFASLNLGAHLQHYNPIIDERVRKEWNVPLNYHLTAQMVFGKIESIDEPKEKIPASERMKTFK